MRFSLLRGGHIDKNGKYKPGSIITTDIDLVQRFGPKFERLHEKGETTTTVVEEVLPEDDEPEENELEGEIEAGEEDGSEDGLEQLTIVKLRELADNEEIDLERLRGKPSIIERIRETRVV